MMRQIESSDITSLVERLCVEANCFISKDIEQCFIRVRETERSPLGREIIGTLLRNADIARRTVAPICQDTGMTVIFVQIGQDVHVRGAFIDDAINEGVRRGYEKGYLRKSVVRDALQRENTEDNTPAVIHYEFVAGTDFHITVSPKGFGSENKSGLQMLTPAQGIPGIKQVVLDTVSHAGANPCPPIIVGVGIGGTMERAALMAKKALLRPVGQLNERADIAVLEQELLNEINQLGIGPAGFGGSTTAMAVNIITGPTHIAGLPVAVNIGCHVTRHAEGSL